MKDLKIAFVYDRVNKIGGAERVLEALHEIWPKAPLYTAVYDQKAARWASVFQVHHSFLQHFPFAVKHHELYPFVTPMAFESFSFDDFDVVLSVTSADAKNIITKPGTVHICYCLTPTRYLWSGINEYTDAPDIGLPRWFTKLIFTKAIPTLRRWDLSASHRPDAYIAISNLVAERITRYYHKNVDRVIYPPVDTHQFTRSAGRLKRKTKPFYLVVSRLVPYKRIDIIIDAFNELGWPLVVVGEGWEKLRLTKRAKSNISFISHLTDKELVLYYQSCRAFIFAGSEDFGIVAGEAQAAGKPVIAYKTSGISEIVRHGQTGILFNDQSVSSLIGALNAFQTSWYDSRLCRNNAERFSKETFKKNMRREVESLYNKYL